MNMTTFSIRFPRTTSRVDAEKIVLEDCCHAKTHAFTEGVWIGSRECNILVADLCDEHKANITTDSRICYFDQMQDFTPKACGGGPAGGG